MSSLANRLERLERIGARMQAFAICLMIATPTVFMILVLLDGPVSLLPIPREIAMDTSSLSLGGYLAIAGFAAIKPAIFLLALWVLYDLFGLYKRGVVFEDSNFRKIRQLGWTLIGIDLVQIVQRLGVGPLLSHLNVTEPFLSIGVGLSFSIIGVFVIVIARILALGRELEKFEQRAL